MAEPIQPINPLDIANAQPTASNFIQSIVKTEAHTADPLLENAPEMDQSLLEEVAPPKSVLLLILKVIFMVLTTASVVSLVFFTTQFSNTFDFITSKIGISNISRELGSSNAEIKTLQTEINFYRYLKAQAYLAHFSFYGDSYLHYFEVAHSQTASDSQKKQAQEIMTSYRGTLQDSFVAAQNELLAPFTATIVQENLDLNELYTQTLTAKLAQFSKSGGEAALHYQYATHLINNTELFALLTSADFEALTESELYEFIKKMNTRIVNNLSLIQDIKHTRIRWSDIMNEIELRTIAVDPHYSQDFYDEFGGIQYTSYEFDAKVPRITITGETKRFDTINFTMIVNLIEELNSSPFFENGEMRSFSKNGSPEEGYTSTLRLSLDLEKSRQDATSEGSPTLKVLPK